MALTPASAPPGAAVCVPLVSTPLCPVVPVLTCTCRLALLWPFPVLLTATSPAGAVLLSVSSLTLTSSLGKCFPLSCLPLGMPDILRGPREASVVLGIPWCRCPPRPSTHTCDCLCYLLDVHAQVSEVLAVLFLGQMNSTRAKAMPLSPLGAPARFLAGCCAPRGYLILHVTS